MCGCGTWYWCDGGCDCGCDHGTKRGMREQGKRFALWYRDMSERAENGQRDALNAAVKRVEALPSIKSVDDETRWVRRSAVIAAIKGEQA
jgi:hypothetical protein